MQAACVIIGIVVSCTTTVPRPTPQEAVTIFSASATPLEIQIPLGLDLDGPTFISVGDDSASSSPWTFPPQIQLRRLDGTSFHQRPQVYGGYNRSYGGRTGGHSGGRRR